MVVVVPGPIVHVPPPGEVFPPGLMMVPPGPIVQVLPGSPDSAFSSRETTEPPLGLTWYPPPPVVESLYVVRSRHLKREVKLTVCTFSMKRGPVG